MNPVIYYWLWGGFLAGAVLIALYLIIRRLRHRKDRIPQEVNASIYEPPDQEALRLLEELEKDTDLLPVDYFFRLSAIFRLYIKRRFGIDAPEMTTEELMPEFRRLELDQGKRDGIKSFLLFSDGVKFAKAACDRDRMTQYLNFVRKLVKETSVPRQPASENLEG
ncbi:MAG: hypothetical protein SWC96_10660 [Thermodesulfobacteriota bacterium]|nr:hypothetical protein [Thermodesulfobacteriota bacterium]